MSVAKFPFWMRFLLIATIFMFVFNAFIFVPWLTAFVALGKLNEWQTLAAGVLALIGAIAIGAMIDAAELYAKSAALFDYGREVADMQARSTRAEVERALFVSGIVAIDDPELYQAVAGRYNN